MNQYVSYDPATGKILGRYTLSEGQEGAYHNLVAVDHLTFLGVPEKYMRVDLKTKELVKKNHIKATASKSTFTANGIDSSTITFTGHSGSVSVLINNVSRGTVDLATPTVTVTSDMPGPFVVQIMTDTDYSDLITVTAV